MAGHPGTLARARGLGHRLGRVGPRPPLGRGAREMGGGGSRASVAAPRRGKRADDVSAGACLSASPPREGGAKQRRRHVGAAT